MVSQQGYAWGRAIGLRSSFGKEQDMATAAATTGGHHSGKWYQHLYVQVLAAITAGILLGHFYPQVGEQMKPLGDAFIKCIKMIIAPIIFFTVVHGIASMRDMKKVGRVGLKALIYFEVLTTAALIIGLIVINLWNPGSHMRVDLSTVDTKSIAVFTAKAKDQGTVQFLMDIIPSTVVGAFANGEILQVLFFAILFAFGLQALGQHGEGVLRLIDVVSHVFFKIVGYIMKAAPIGAFGAMAFTIGKYGLATLISLGSFMLAFYVTCLLFIFGVLGAVASLCGFSIFKFIRYIKEELLIVLGTSSSEISTAAYDRQDGKSWLRKVGRRPGHSDRLFVQPRWHLHLPDNGRDLPGAGDRYVPVDLARARHHWRSAPYIQRRRRRHGIRLHRSGRNTCIRRDDSSREYRLDPRH